MSGESILLKRGERGMIIGQTGSGKTVGALVHMQATNLYPVIILDTKGEPAFNDIADEGDEETPAEESIIYEEGEKFISQWHHRRQPEYSIVRPTPAEMADSDQMDSILTRIYDTNKKCLIYIDECYQWHVNGRAGNGLIGLLTRGRSKGMSVLMSTQRPTWVSRFCFTEAQKFYIYKLSDKRDHKVIAEYIPDFMEKPIAQKHYFHYYDNSEDEKGIRYFKPVPYEKKARRTENNQSKRGGKWL